MLEMAVGYTTLKKLLTTQLTIFNGCFVQDKILQEALRRTERCFSELTNKYYSKNGNPFFSPSHTGQYAQFLYFLCRAAYEAGEMEMAEKCYSLNKMLHGVDWFYEVKLPEVWFADHAMGSVLGRAEYTGSFVVVQGCTVGQNHDVYPHLGNNIVMHPYSMVIGNSRIGDNVEISSYAMIRDTDIPSNCLVFGQSPDLKVVRRTGKEMQKRIPYFAKEPVAVKNLAGGGTQVIISSV